MDQGDIECTGETILQEIQDTLQKRDAMLIHKPGCMVLAIAINGQWRAIAQVKLVAAQVGLAQGRIDWRPIEWPQEVRLQ